MAGRSKSARVILENVYSFVGDGDDIFFVDQNGFFARLSRDTGTIATIGRPGFLLDGRPLRFIIGTRSLALIDPSGGLFLYEKDAGALTAVASEILDASFDSKELANVAEIRQIDQPASRVWAVDGKGVMMALTDDSVHESQDVAFFVNSEQAAKSIVEPLFGNWKEKK